MLSDVDKAAKSGNILDITEYGDLFNIYGEENEDSLNHAISKAVTPQEVKDLEVAKILLEYKNASIDLIN
ncbi:hypothetical protein ACFLY2_00870 [Patescibacteria group bacterium]